MQAVAHVEDVKLPDIGDFADVEVIEILVAPGDRVEAEQSLLTLESDKATMEIPAPAGGLVRELKVKIGDKISKGDSLLTLETGDAGSADTPPAEAPAASAERPSPAAQAPAEQPRPSSPKEAEPVEVRLPDIGDFSRHPRDRGPGRGRRPGRG